MSYLHRNKSGTYVFRRGIPEALRSTIGRGREWGETLRTKDIAVAKGRLHEVAARVEQAFTEARQRSASAVHETAEAALPPHVIQQIVRAWKERELYRRAERLTQEPLADRAEWDEEVELLTHDPLALQGKTPAQIKECFDRTKAYDTRVERQFLEAAKAFGYTVTKRSPSLHVGWHMLRDAWIEVVKEEGRWRNFDYSTLPRTAPEPIEAAAVNSKAAKAGKTELLFSEALERWAAGGAARSTKAPSSGTVQEARSAARRFIELYGDMPIASIKRRHGSGFREALASIPTGLKPNLNQRPIQELLRMDWSGFPRKSATTVNKSLTLLAAVMARAEKDGHFDDLNWRNPFNVPYTTSKADEDNYEPFDVQELNKLMASAVFARAERPIRGRVDTAKWAPLLALFQGARRSEILQLYVRDVYVDKATGLPVIRFARDADKSIKTDTSIRIVPLHAKIVELGFLQFMEARRKKVGADSSLWEGFEDREKMRSTINKWSEWFNSYLKAHVVDSPTKAFHSFRGTFKRFGHDAGVPERILDRLVGHAISGVGATYGRRRQADGGRDTGVPLERLASEINRIKFRHVLFKLIK